MDTTLEVQLLNQSVALPDLSIGQAMDIAMIPSEYNEKRLSAMIGHLTGDLGIAGKLTAQERYYTLLSHQAAAQHQHSGSSDIDEYIIPTVQSEVPNQHQIGGMYINHLLGAHVVVLEGICENAYDWVRGQMACQISGDLASIIGGDSDALKWDAIDAGMSDNEINALVQERSELLHDLSANGKFNLLYDTYAAGVDVLTHFVMLGCENQGLNVIKQGGDGNNEPSRFHPLDSLQGIAKVLAECIA